MSPFYYDARYNIAFMWRVDSVGGIQSLDNDGATGTRGLRPSIALNYNVQATYDKTSEYEPGNVNNPYIISV